MKILLTGGAGQLRNTLLQPNSALHALGEIISPDIADFDLSKPESLRAAVQSIRPNVIINPAAYTAVDKAESESDLAFKINAESPAVLAEEAKKIGAALIHYSTDYVFDGSKRAADGSFAPYVETDTTNPLNVYGKSKLAGDLAIQASGCHYLIFRTSWVYSLFGHNFLLTMLRLAGERDELKIVNDQWGAPTSAGWLADATTAVLQQHAKAADSQAWWQANSGLYNLTTTGATSWHGFTEEIVRQASAQGRLSKTPSSIIGIPASDYPTPAKRPTNSRLATDKFAQQFGLRVPTWQEALATCLS